MPFLIFLATDNRTSLVIGLLAGIRFDSFPTVHRHMANR